MAGLVVGLSFSSFWLEELPLCLSDCGSCSNKNLGVACSLYIDDRLNGELFTPVGFWSRPISQRDRDFSFRLLRLQYLLFLKFLFIWVIFLALRNVF